ncbi:MAG: CDP-archaeol synthase [Cyanobacteria bacterium P01_A01_bin.17]
MPTVANQLIQDSFNLIWLLLGLFAAGILEAYLWQTSLLEWANHPIQREWFGENKRWRGLLSLPLTHLLTTFCFQSLEHYGPVPETWISFTDVDTWAYGLLVGFICNLAELPNSFIKRRLQVPAGGQSGPLFFILDHIDSSTGIVMLWWLCFHFPLHLVVTGFLLSPLLFVGATFIRIRLGLKQA